MGLIAAASKIVERVPVPDPLTRAGIDFLCGRTARSLSRTDADAELAFAREMAARPIAINTHEANAQHYEVPADFFGLVLGPHRKYSCCYYDGTGPRRWPMRRSVRCELTVEHADLRDGQDILELGCGWGSLSLFMAQRYPKARITAVSNSQSQREFIESEAQLRQIRNLRVVTCDMNAFSPGADFRPRGLGRDVRAHVELALAVRARALMDEAGRPLLHACVQSPPRPLSIRSHRSGRLDRAVFLHRRHHAEPQSAAAVFRPVRRRAGLAAGTARITSARRSTGLRISMRGETRSSRCCGRVYGAGCGAMGEALAHLLPRHGRHVRPCGRQRMGRQPLPDAGGVIPTRVRLRCPISSGSPAIPAATSRCRRRCCPWRTCLPGRRSR